MRKRLERKELYHATKEVTITCRGMKHIAPNIVEVNESLWKMKLPPSRPAT